jgi:pyruvate, orthophosphate dikinase
VYILRFSEGAASQKDLLGGKGANLCEMTNLGFPVPPGVVITTETCNTFRKLAGDSKKAFVSIIVHKVMEALGDWEHPISVSVRSGARVSMPGMMDTILNVSEKFLTEDGWVVPTLSMSREDLDAYRRFLSMYAEVVLQAPPGLFPSLLDSTKKLAGVVQDVELSKQYLVYLIRQYLAEFKKAERESCLYYSFEEVLASCIYAVFRSWDNPRAKLYREMNGYPENWGTAVVIQQMVMGNKDENSCSGVLFTRDPGTGAPGVVGEFLPMAQGEDVVAGIRTPLPLVEMETWGGAELYANLLDLADQLEKYFKDMQDVEFTVESGKLYLLQTRNAKRSPEAVLQVAMDMFAEDLISLKEMKRRVPVSILRTQITRKIVSELPAIGKGIPAGGGPVVGLAAYSSEAAQKITHELKCPVVLLVEETTPEDLAGMAASVGILTKTGGMTSHAAVVARGMGKTCVVGSSFVSLETGSIGCIPVIQGETLIGLNGLTGEVWVGDSNTLKCEPGKLSQKACNLIDMVRPVGIPQGRDFFSLYEAVSLDAREFCEEVVIEAAQAGVKKLYVNVAPMITRIQNLSESETKLITMTGLSMGLYLNKILGRLIDLVKKRDITKYLPYGIEIIGFPLEFEGILAAFGITVGKKRKVQVSIGDEYETFELVDLFK